MGRQVIDILFRMTELKLERIIAEIVDNSLDADAKKIKVDFFGINKDESDVGFSVMDNGIGFDSTEQLFNSWEIELKSKTRSEEEIGKYHVGMKLAPLTKYKTIYVVTIIDDEAWITKAENAAKTGKSFNMDSKTHENPTKPEKYKPSDKSIPSYVHEQIKVFGKPKKCEWKTCFIAVDKWRDLLDDGSEAYSDIIENNYFQKHMVQFLGVTYQLYLENDKNLSISVADTIVNAIDPFWRNYTPNEFQKGLKILNTKLKASKISGEKIKIKKVIEFNEAMSKFGTFAGKTLKSSVIDGLEITPYVIPQQTARGLIAKIAPNGWDGKSTKPFTGSVQNAPSEVFASDEACGFFFYRGKRLITFGNFYKLNIKANDGNQIRILVKFPSSAEPDSFEVAPNKQRMDYISKEAWEEIFDGFGLKSGSEEWAEPFNQKAPFFLPIEAARKTPKKTKNTGNVFKHNNLAHYPNILVRNSEDWVKYIKCKKPSDGGCGLLHEKKDLCPEAPCPICTKNNKGCVPGVSCTFKCPYCSKVGIHTGINCPDYCSTCKSSHKGKKCPKIKVCKKCKKDEPDCVCPCDRCGQAKPCALCCSTCAILFTKCPCGKIDSTTTTVGDKTVLKLMSYNKSQNIVMIKEVMKNLGISHKDLK
jgi:hypothetical protein